MSAPLREMVVRPLLDPSVAADPHSHYRVLRDHAPVHFDGSVDAYLLSRHADVKAAYRHPAMTTAVVYERMIGAIYGNSLPQMVGAEHAWWRRVLNPHFRGAILHDQWNGFILRNTQQLLADAAYRQARRIAGGFQQGDEIDLVKDLMNRLPMCIVADMLGLPVSDYQQFIEWHQAQMAFLGNVAKDPLVHQRGLDATEELHGYLDPLIQRRRDRPGDDLISVLATQRVDGELLERGAVISRVMEIVNSGSDTTGKTMGNLFSRLLAERHLFDAVRNDRALVTNAISETLRLMPPSQMNLRTTTEPVEIAGGTIPAEATVFLLLASANRDDRRFADPEVFDLHRTDVHHDRTFTSSGDILSFGHGEHHCLGALFAKEEVSIVVNTLLDEYPQMRLSNPAQPPVEVGLKYRAVQSLPVVL